ncbi:MAG: UDP-N-acetylenolpyruvoylglucosamine reductase [Desulfobacterales bacterium C00003060]|nr:MAG: UDP-N-acetylenolpyruvoylglucosamine reductase [Desulfobacterales bacterium S3730MH5]OEU77287.1 MAG: UDP-N-acetylenolpyruvoylglucosamine reductase [Desulfobacterales bacterium C00003060]OEU84089.1 MAG: UDP-N-acetylenolpyruvoylglucosamine reductase [Desulfobacterales bacterium S5133MH4]
MLYVIFGALVTVKLTKNKPLAQYTTIGVGGAAEYFCQPCNLRELLEALSYAKAHDLPVVWLGGGSNILIHDRGISGLVLRLANRASNLVVKGDLVIAEAGSLLFELVKHACKGGFLDLSFCAGIPGTCGGAVYMNAGTSNGEISQKIAWVELLDPATGSLKVRSSQEMGFGYRTSILQQEPGIVTRVAFYCEEGDGKLWWEKARAQIARRKKLQPQRVRTAGSFFRNPPEQVAGVLIERAGLKGARIGDALVSTIHGNFLVNAGQASSDHFIQLIRLVRRSVFEKFGVRLELEVSLLGFSEKERGDVQLIL